MIAKRRVSNTPNMGILKRKEYDTSQTDNMLTLISQENANQAVSNKRSGGRTSAIISNFKEQETMFEASNKFGG